MVRSNFAGGRAAAGDTVRFKVQKVYNLADWNHVSDARNVNFTEFVNLSSEPMKHV